MSELQLSDPRQELMVTEEIVRAHPRFPDYPLLPEDLITRTADGTWRKYAPGMAVEGFVLSDEQVRRLKPVWVQSAHLLYEVLGDVPDGEESDEVIAMKRGNHGYSF